MADGPWSHPGDAEATSAYERYRARVGAALPDAATYLAEASSLDELIAAKPEHFGPPSDAQLRGFTDLMKVDPRVRMFLPGGGLAVWAPLSDSDAIVFAQQRLRARVLNPSVPEDLLQYFDGLRKLQLYGSFAYDFFSMVETLSKLGHELALGVKFIEAYQGLIPLAHRDDGAAILEVSMFHQVEDALAFDGTYPLRSGWRLRDHKNFRPSLTGLLHWARERGLLTLWLDRQWDRSRWAVASVDLGRNQPHRWTPPEYDTWAEHERTAW